MATVGSLFVNIVAKTKPLEDGVKTARRRLKEFSTRMSTSAGRAEFFAKKMKNARKSLNRFGKRMGLTIGGLKRMAAMAALAGAALVSAFVVKGLSAVDALAKKSRVLGITIAQLAGFRFAAQQTGVDVNVLTKGLQNMAKNISQAAMDLGTAKHALGMLGLSAQDLVNLSPDEQFLKIAGALESITNPADRVRIAFDIFGGRAVDLLNTLALGEEGMKAMAAEAEALGLAVSEGSAAKVEEANDAFNRFKQLLQGVANSMAVELAPVITAVSNALVEAGKRSGGFGDIIFSVMRGAAKAIGFFLDGFYTIKIAVAAARAIFISYGAVVGTILTNLAFAANVFARIVSMDRVNFSGFIDQLEAVRDGFAETAKAYKDEMFDLINGEWPSERVDKFVQSLARSRKEMNNAVDSHKVQTDAIREQTLALEQLKKAEDERQELMKQGEQVTRDVMTPLEKYTEKIESLKKMLEAGAITQETFDRAMKKAKETLEKATAVEPVEMQVEPVVDEKVFDPSGAIGQISSALGEFKFATAMPAVPAPGGKGPLNDPMFELQEEGNEELKRMRELIARLVDNNTGVLI